MFQQLNTQFIWNLKFILDSLLKNVVIWTSVDMNNTRLDYTSRGNSSFINPTPCLHITINFSLIFLVFEQTDRNQRNSWLTQCCEYQWYGRAPSARRPSELHQKSRIWIHQKTAFHHLSKKKKTQKTLSE